MATTSAANNLHTVEPQHGRSTVTLTAPSRSSAADISGCKCCANFILTVIASVFCIGFIPVTFTLTSNYFYPAVNLVVSTTDADSGGGVFLPANWNITLMVDADLQADYVFDRVEAAILRSGDDLVIATSDPRQNYSGNGYLKIQLRTTAAAMVMGSDQLMDPVRFSDFSVLVLAWVHTEPDLSFPKKRYVSRFSCSRLLWDRVMGYSTEETLSYPYTKKRGKCDVYVKLQKKARESWTRLNMTRHN